MMRTSRLRDSQRQKVYDAERILESYSQRVETVPEIEAYLKYIWSLKRVRDAFPAGTNYGPPRVKDGRRCRRAKGGASDITMPRWARTQYIVVHEVSHSIQVRTYGRRLDMAWHGWQFCDIYLRLVLYVMGREAHDALKASFKAARVKFRQPRKRELTPEQRQAAALRLWAAREERKRKSSAVNTLLTPSE